MSRLLTKNIGKLTVIGKIKIDQNWKNQEEYIHFLSWFAQVLWFGITNLSRYKGTEMCVNAFKLDHNLTEFWQIKH